MKYFWWGLGIFVIGKYCAAVVTEWIKRRQHAEIWNNIIEGTIDNMRLLHEETVKLIEDWKAWTFDDRKKALFDVLFGEHLKDDSNRERSIDMAYYTLDMILDSNPTLEWDQHIFEIMIGRRMELAKRAARKAQKAK